MIAQRSLMLMIALISLSASADHITQLTIPKNNIPLCPNPALISDAVKVNARRLEIVDQFPLEIQARKISIQAVPGRLAKLMDESAFRAFPTGVEIRGRSVRSILDSLLADGLIQQADYDLLFSRIPDKQIFDCNDVCDPNKAYGRIWIYNLIPAVGKKYQNVSCAVPFSESLEGSNLCDAHKEDLENSVIIPERAYLRILEMSVSHSYELDVLIPSDVDETTLEQAAEYLGSLTSKESALALLQKARMVGKVSLFSFLPKELQPLVNQYDYASADNCHSFALSSVDADFRKYRQRYPQYLRPLANPYVRNREFFDFLSSTSGGKQILGPLRFGDVLWAINHHSMVYLANGYIVQKDNTGFQWLYRAAHLQDLGKGDYVNYFGGTLPCFPDRKLPDELKRDGLLMAGRRNSKPLSLDPTEIIQAWSQEYGEPLELDRSGIAITLPVQ